VVTDLEMPVMNGMEMIRRIRALDDRIPIIITTAYDDEAHSCPEANRVIIKPIMFNELLDTIMECLEERQ
jgi:CheY-like chemotaxis protein